MTPKTVSKILDHIGCEYSKKWSEQEKALKIETWSMMLEEVTDEQGKIGLKKALEDPGDFMPSVGKFKQMCLSGKGASNLEDEARKAWGLIIDNLNPTVSPIFKDTAISETVRKMGGWKRLCDMQTDEMPFRRKEFVELYPIYRRQKQVFNPMLKGNDALFENGKLINDYRFIGFSSEEGRLKALEMIETAKTAESMAMKMLSSCRHRQNDRAKK